MRKYLINKSNKFIKIGKSNNFIKSGSKLFIVTFLFTFVISLALYLLFFQSQSQNAFLKPNINNTSYNSFSKNEEENIEKDDIYQEKQLSDEDSDKDEVSSDTEEHEQIKTKKRNKFQRLMGKVFKKKDK